MLSALLAGCGRVAGVAPPQGGAALPPPPANAAVFRIDPQASELRILVYRSGALASLGHNHVISSQSLSGQVWMAAKLQESVVQISLPADSLQVDIPALRDEEGADFPGALDPQAIQATRANMLGERVLDAARFPVISLRTRALHGRLPDLVLDTDIDLHGRVATLPLPAQVTVDGDSLLASGEFSLRQSALGLEPFSVMMGALSVRDELRIKYRIRATRE